MLCYHSAFWTNPCFYAGLLFSSVCQNLQYFMNNDCICTFRFPLGPYFHFFLWWWAFNRTLHHSVWPHKATTLKFCDMFKTLWNVLKSSRNVITPVTLVDYADKTVHIHSKASMKIMLCFQQHFHWQTCFNKTFLMFYIKGNLQVNGMKILVFLNISTGYKLMGHLWN